jgi:hypothetical protein
MLAVLMAMSTYLARRTCAVYVMKKTNAIVLQRYLGDGDCEQQMLAPPVTPIAPNGCSTFPRTPHSPLPLAEGAATRSSGSC